MSEHFTKTNMYRWIFILMVVGVFAFPLASRGSLKEKFISLAAVEDVTNWDLARNDRIHEEDVDWTLS